jgi:hypothetical protein
MKDGLDPLLPPTSGEPSLVSVTSGRYPASQPSDDPKNAGHQYAKDQRAQDNLSPQRGEPIEVALKADHHRGWRVAIGADRDRVEVVDVADAVATERLDNFNALVECSRDRKALGPRPLLAAVLARSLDRLSERSVEAMLNARARVALRAEAYLSMAVRVSHEM